MAVAFTETDLQNIRTARLRGIRTVTYGDRTVTYSSDAEMRQVEQDILKELSAASTTRKRQFYGVGSKGF